MKRIIVDYSTLNNEILDLLVTKFPDGYMKRDILTYTNAKGKFIKAVEVETNDIKYLVKISSRLEEKIEDYLDDNFEDDLFLEETDYL